MGAVFFLAVWILFSSPAQAKEIYVGWFLDPYQDIQEAIDAAEDGIIVRDGVYAPPADGFDLQGKAIALRSWLGAANCIIDGGQSKRGFVFHSGESADSKIDGFTIRNCKAEHGGGIYCYSSSPTITNCILRSISTSHSNLLITYSNVPTEYAGETNIDLDPQFVDASSGDFRLKASSPCIDAGSNTAPSIPSQDKDGGGDSLLQARGHRHVRG